MIDHIVKAGCGLGLCVVIIMLFTIDNPPLLNDDMQAALAAVSLPEITSRDDPAQAAQRRTFALVQQTYRKQCELWHKDCDLIRDLR